MQNITNDVRYIGVDDHKIDLFEGQYRVPKGMAYNSYVVLDEKITVFDTVDIRFTHEWLDNLGQTLGERVPDYLVVQHMEPDHSANLLNFMKTYPSAKIVANTKTLRMMAQFFDGIVLQDKTLTVSDGDTLCTGRHTFTFVFAPMVHWPEVMVTYDACDKILFSADGFGKFGALDAEEPWDDEARRYYFGIVGKYGVQVQGLLKKAAALDIDFICPLHGPVLHETLAHNLKLYDLWSSYQAENEGVMIAYTSVYGNTKKAIEQLAEKLKAAGCPQVAVYDLCRCDMSAAVSDAFRFDKLVLATTTYNAGIFPFMREFIAELVERRFQNRTVALVENGTWAPLAAKIMKQMLENCENLTFASTAVKINSAPNKDTTAALDQLTGELCQAYIAAAGDRADKSDMKALFRIGYGLYVVTSHDGKRDNGLIVNTVSQVSDAPNRIAVTINQQNYSHHIIKQTGMMNVNCLTVDAPFSVFENFGFQSGRTADKFREVAFTRSDNGLAILTRYVNSVMCLKVEQYVDLGTHGMFICSVTEARVLSDRPTMTYADYHASVKPKPETAGKKGWVCTICGYVHEEETLPDDFICPLCKHGAADFEAIQ